MIDFGVEMINKLVDKGFNSPTDKKWWIGKLLEFMKAISPAEYTKAYFAVYNQLPLDFENPYEPDSSLEARLSKLAVRLHDEGSYVNAELVSRAVDRLRMNIPDINWSHDYEYRWNSLSPKGYSIGKNESYSDNTKFWVKFNGGLIGDVLPTLDNAKGVALRHHVSILTY